MSTSKRLRAVQAGAVLVAGALALTACGSSSSKKGVSLASDYSFGSIPAAASAVTDGGTVHLAEFPGAGPKWIFPITPAAVSSVYATYQFQDPMWRPLLWPTVGPSPEFDYTKSLTDAAPTIAADGKTVTIKLNTKYTWNDGTPVTSNDVIFYIDLLKAAVKESAANFGNYTPGQFPDNITSATANDAQTVTLVFDKAYNPNWIIDTQLDLIVPLPSKKWAVTSVGGAPLDYTNPANAKQIYDFIASRSKNLAGYGSDPLWQVVDGPFKIKSYNVSTNATDLVANPAYSGPNKPHIAELDELAYTSTDAEFNDLLSGKLDIGGVDFSDIPQLSRLKAKGYSYFGLPTFGFQYLYYNFQDKTDNFDKIIAQDYVRQAFAHLQNEDAVIKGVLHGAGAPAYGPVAVAPTSPFTPKDVLTNPFPYSITTAKQLLSDHGWKVVPNGVTTCVKPGTGSDECGAGIAAGQKIDFTLWYTTSPAIVGQQDTAWVAALKQIGISVSLKTDTFNNIVANENDPSSPNNANNWGAADFGGFTENNYPSTNTLFNTGGSFNQGNYSNKELDKLISDSQNSSDPMALTKELDAVTQDQPGMFQPLPDEIYAWKNTLSGPAEAFSNTSQYVITPEQWYFTK